MRPCAFQCTTSFNPRKNLVKHIQLLFYKWGNWDLERLNTLLGTTRTARDRAQCLILVSRSLNLQLLKVVVLLLGRYGVHCGPTGVCGICHPNTQQAPVVEEARRGCLIQDEDQAGRWRQIRRGWGSCIEAQDSITGTIWCQRTWRWGQEMEKLGSKAEWQPGLVWGSKLSWTKQGPGHWEAGKELFGKAR